MKNMRLKESNQEGFTILELLIATTVLSVILVMTSVVMVGIGSLYQKGINQARVQTATRNITKEVSEQLQQVNSGSAIVGPSSTVGGYTFRTYCFGNIRYTYVVGVQQGTDSTIANPQIPHVLWRDTPASTCGSAPVPVLSDNSSIPTNSAAGGTELVPPKSRLTVFEIPQTSPGLYNVRVGVAYGDNDLLTGTVGPTVRCNTGKGSQFCSAAFLSTTVGRRL